MSDDDSTKIWLSMFIFRIRCEQRINEEHTGSTEAEVFSLLFLLLLLLLLALLPSFCFCSTGVTCLLAAEALAVDNISRRLSNVCVNVNDRMRHELVTTVKIHKLSI